jgi:hypothetical protein
MKAEWDHKGTALISLKLFVNESYDKYISIFSFGKILILKFFITQIKQGDLILKKLSL